VNALEPASDRAPVAQPASAPDARTAPPGVVRVDPAPVARARRPELQPRALLTWGLAAVALALGILLCALALAVLVGVLSLMNGGAFRSMGQPLGEAAQRSAQAVAEAEQSVRDAFDPRHPPRGGLRQDAEFDALQVVGVGELLGEAGASELRLAGLAKRNDAQDLATAQYAIIRRALAAPQPRRVLGVPLGEDRGEQEHYLYRGQSFRLGARYYKVNWVSLDRQQVGVARYRSADDLIGPLAFEYD